jgi:hypothetical protein
MPDDMNFHAIDLNSFQTGYLLGLLDRFVREVPLDDIEKKWVSDIRNRVWAAVERDSYRDSNVQLSAEDAWRFTEQQVKELRESGAPETEMQRWYSVTYHLSWHMFNMEGK